MIRIIVSICLVISLLSCGDKNGIAKGKIISNDKMQEVLWDIFQADAFTEKYIKTDTSKNAIVQNAALQQKVFELHKISREDFNTSYNYYSTHPDLMRTLLDSISVKAERKRGQMMKDRYSGKKVAE